MNKVFFVILLVASFSSFANKSSDNAVWGTIVSPQKAISGIQYKYYVYFEREGQVHAYPVETTSKELAEQIEKNLNQKVRIQGHVKEETLPLDGSQKKILVFLPKAIKPLTLSELSVAQGETTLPTPSPSPAKKGKEYNGGGIRINDTAANAIIYTGAAVIIGSQLGKILFSK